MCGILGYVGTCPCKEAEKVVMDGLARLEYRGYDSAGIGITTNNGIAIRKKAGKLANLRESLNAQPLPEAIAGIGHTRWATHGGPTDSNAHPHRSSDATIAVVHNGIIENADNLRRALEKEGYAFVSETDTEVIANLVAHLYSQDSSNATMLTQGGATVPKPAGNTGDQETAARLARALHQATTMLQGTFTVLAIHNDCPGIIVAARRSSPLVIGLGKDCNYLGSDVLAFAEHTSHCLEIGQDQLVMVTAKDVVVADVNGKPLNPRHYEIDFSIDRVSKAGWETFMEKEINEQPRGITDTLADRIDAKGYLTLDELRISADVLRQADKMIIIACGTASYAGLVARYAIEHWCRIPVEVEIASEFRYRDPIVNQKTLVVAISQSGETMDTIMAVRHARDQGAKVLAIVNTPGSTISRESDAVLLTHAGPEIAVASTKAFTAQVAACYLLGLYLAQVRGNKYIDEIADYMEKLGKVPSAIQRVLNESQAVKDVARMYGKALESTIFLGRHVGFPVALEGALKLKEIAYVHAEGFAAGELKHGPIALVEEGQLVFVVVPTPRRPELHDKVISNIQEVRARGAVTLVIAEEGDEKAAQYANHIFRVPQLPTLYAPLVTAIPLQIFACEVAKEKGYDVDQPRNLAKSVTVE
ncbi:glutamine--fructose-6-phosphate transaminase (isomerizing) [Actinotignum urinale]|uniref:glutamine--fructose-6-phosphate transaminase (isomerizing) n=1 Tax=Actinotignum urinale TaxID=190146 RepID=UPI002A83610E|nr:glutamine--fructose-6-phosphate transaminase (isomerizing) [Actinotignum urinale]MDY5128540.1 glutamine--fructose-6-phosphate transaminase (isomerizing) [Actinotignum urinale]